MFRAHDLQLCRHAGVDACDQHEHSTNGATSRVRASPTAELRRPTELNKCVVVLNRDDHPDENAGDGDDPHRPRADELECLGELTKTPGATERRRCGASCPHQEK